MDWTRLQSQTAVIGVIQTTMSDCCHIDWNRLKSQTAVLGGSLDSTARLLLKGKVYYYTARPLLLGGDPDFSTRLLFYGKFKTTFQTIVIEGGPEHTDSVQQPNDYFILALTKKEDIAHNL